MKHPSNELLANSYHFPCTNRLEHSEVPATEYYRFPCVAEVGG